jgi:glycosyltransferase involved in cell wall biosynthesis
MGDPTLRKKIVLFANTDWYLYNFRLDFALALQKTGYDVLLLSPDGPYRSKMEALGLRWINFPISRRGINPIRELAAIWRLIKIYQQECPDIVHHFTIKCVFYGSTAAHFTGVKKIINSITGLGYVFLGEDIKVRMIRWVAVNWYRLILHGTEVIFLNKDDMAFFINGGIIRADEAIFIAGDGVNTTQYAPDKKKRSLQPIVVLACRMLYDKGVAEFVQAAQQLKKDGINARFVLVGNIDSGNPSAIAETQLQAWQQEGDIEWWGWHDKMEEVFQQASIACLPSYREGLPKMLIEAGACGLPLVATDVPGCREIVIDGKNGLLVPPRDAIALADAIGHLLKNEPLREKLGECSRLVIERQYSTRIIVDKTLSVYEGKNPGGQKQR